MKFWHHFLYFSLQLFTFFCYQSPISSIPVSNANNLNALQFLPTTYDVKNDRTLKEFCVRQVPGDGGCLFHSISVWLSYIKHRKHVPFSSAHEKLSMKLRSLAVKLLQSDENLYLEGSDCMSGRMLLHFTSEFNGTTPEEYCRRMLLPHEWGGGPEIVALSNHFKCPIRVYQLSTWMNPKQKKLDFCLELSSTFGSPTFKNKHPICLLHAQGAFPDIPPEHVEISDRNHFLALFPPDHLSMLKSSSPDPLQSAPSPTSTTRPWFKRFFPRFQRSQAPSQSNSSSSASSKRQGFFSGWKMLPDSRDFCDLSRCPYFQDNSELFSQR